MTKCPSCGTDIDPSAANSAASNSQKMITLQIPEADAALMRVVFQEMNIKLGMHGLGELANQLRPYHDKFMENAEHLRFFDDRNLAMAFRGVEYGYKIEVRIGEDRPAVGVIPDPRVTVDVDFIREGEKTKTLNVADNATRNAAEWFKAYFEDAAIRLAPLEEDGEN